jgi:NADPH2:quinone reductase
VRTVIVRGFGGPEMLRLEDVPPPAPGPGQLLVRLLAVGVNPVDAYIRSGIGSRPPLPYTPGEDGAGVVERLGPDTGVWADGRNGGSCHTPFMPAVGERVYLYGSVGGTYAEYALCRPEHVHPLPERLSFDEGAAIGVPYGTAYRALFQRAAATAGETVLVHGATGGVGLATVQLAATAGLQVIASGSSEEGRRLALANGAAHAVDHTDDDHFEQIRTITGGQGVDVVVESRSDLNLGRDLTVLAPGGRVICVGNRGPGNQGEVAVNARDLMRREGAILGVFLPAPGCRALADIHATLAQGLVDGTLKPVVARRYPLAQAADAHRELMAGHSMGKFVLQP